jgi:hypothetical protein
VEDRRGGGERHPDSHSARFRYHLKIIMDQGLDSGRHGAWVPYHPLPGRRETTEKHWRNSSRRDTDSFLTMNSPNPADPSDGIGWIDAASQVGIVTRTVWAPGAREMLAHVTRDWKNHYVTTEVLSFDELRDFAIRPFVLIVRLDAPILERFRRKTRYSLEFFCG